MDTKDEYVKLLKSTIISGNSSSDETDKLLMPIIECISKLRPRKLFRHRTCTEYNFDALLNDKIYFNTPTKFNDPHDCFSYVDMKKIKSELLKTNTDSILKNMEEIRKSEFIDHTKFSPNELPMVVEQYNKLKSMSEFELAEIYNKIKTLDFDDYKKKAEIIIDCNHLENLKRAREEAYIACFSEDFDSTLMWAHYSDFHKGYVLEYETEDLVSLTFCCYLCKEKCKNKHDLSLYPVVYSDQRCDSTEYEIETCKLTLSTLLGYDLPFSPPDKLFIIKQNIYKGLDWAYEKEWRLIYTCLNKKSEFKYEVVKPKAIYFGSKMTDSNKSIIRKLIDGKKIPIFQMYIEESNKEYKLNFKSV